MQELSGFLADLVLLAHGAVVVFVVGGLPAILLGGRLGWSWSRRWGWRLAHAAAIGVIVGQAWMGRLCPLTTLEDALRRRAGADVDGSVGFVQRWVSRLLYYDAPGWVFTTAYTVFGLLVAYAWWRYPPGRRLGGGVG